MSTAISDLGIMLLVTGVGVAFGWLFHAVLARRLVTCDAETAGDGAQRAREVMARLHELAARVAADVGQHSHRVEAINEELHAADVGEPEAVVKAIANLMEANNQMQQQLTSAEGKLQEQAKQIQIEATAARTDALTGLANRRALDDEIARRAAESQRCGRTFSLLMIDVDHFKKFNDTHGHQAGDEVLRGVGRVLRQNAREMDVPARFGGEEFAVIFPGARAADVAASVERIRKAIAQTPFHFAGADLHVTVSLGVAHLVENEDGAALIRRADAALYASKDAGRNCAHWHDGQATHRIGGEPAPAAPKAMTSSATTAIEAAPAAPPRAKEVPPATEKSGSQPGGPAQVEAKADTDEPRATSQTGVYNRTEFCVVLGRRLAEWRRGGTPLSVLLVQLDRYQDLVARHGQAAGGLAMRATSQFLTAAIRDMDLAAQYDGTTFALMLPGARLANTVDVAERLRQAIGRCNLPVGNTTVPITVSLGAAESNAHDDMQTLLGRAEQALDVARNAGGNRGFFHNGEFCQTAAAALDPLSARH
jgi:diguanylate cyclase